MLFKKCLCCKTDIPEDRNHCITCGYIQEIRIPSERSGPCKCQMDGRAGKMLVATFVDTSGQKLNFCMGCVTDDISVLLAKNLIEANVNLPNQEISNRLLALARRNGRYNYSETQKKQALFDTIALIHSANERSRVSYPLEE